MLAVTDGVLFQVFKLVSGHVTLGSLCLILEVLEPKTSKEELMEDEDEEEEDGEDGGDGDDDGDDAEEESEMDEDDEGGSDISNGSECGEVDPAFREEVQKALGAAAVDSDAEVCLASPAITQQALSASLLLVHPE